MAQTTDSTFVTTNESTVPRTTDSTFVATDDSTVPRIQDLTLATTNESTEARTTAPETLTQLSTRVGNVTEFRSVLVPFFSVRH